MVAYVSFRFSSSEKLTHQPRRGKFVYSFSSGGELLWSLAWLAQLPLLTLRRRIIHYH